MISKKHLKGTLSLRYITLMQKYPPNVFCGKGVLRNFTKFTGKNLCQSLFFNKVADLRPEISKNTFFYRTSPVAASAYVKIFSKCLFCLVNSLN